MLARENPEELRSKGRLPDDTAFQYMINMAALLDQKGPGEWKMCQVRATIIANVYRSIRTADDGLHPNDELTGQQMDICIDQRGRRVADMNDTSLN